MSTTTTATTRATVRASERTRRRVRRLALHAFLLAAAIIWLFPLLWALYLSYVSVGREFLSFQWDVLLLEMGLAVLAASSVYETDVDEHCELIPLASVAVA